MSADSDDFDLEAMKNARSSTPPEKRSRCPECYRTQILRTNTGVAGPEVETDYTCRDCGNRFDEPARIETDGGREIGQSTDGTERSMIMRHVVREPTGGTAGFGVAHVRNPPPHETEYRVEQLWSDGEAEPVYIGDRDDALRLISALTEAIRHE